VALVYAWTERNVRLSNLLISSRCTLETVDTTKVNIVQYEIRMRPFISYHFH